MKCSFPPSKNEESLNLLLKDNEHWVGYKEEINQLKKQLVDFLAKKVVSNTDNTLTLKANSNLSG